MAIPEKDELAILRLSLVEMQRTYDHITNIYDQLRVKALAFIAGEVAIVTFLFTAEVMWPNILYGKVLFLSAIVSLLLAFGLLLWTIASVQWKIPCDFERCKDMACTHSTELKMARYIHDEYLSVLNYCIPLVDKKAKKFNLTIYLLSASVIIVLLIKYGGPK